MHNAMHNTSALSCQRGGSSPAHQCPHWRAQPPAYWLSHRWLCCWTLQRHLLCLQALQRCSALRWAALPGWGLSQNPFCWVLWTCGRTLVALRPASPQTEISFLHQDTVLSVITTVPVSLRSKVLAGDIAGWESEAALAARCHSPHPAGKIMCKIVVCSHNMNARLFQNTVVTPERETALRELKPHLSLCQGAKNVLRLAKM